MSHVRTVGTGDSIVALVISLSTYSVYEVLERVSKFYGNCFIINFFKFKIIYVAQTIIHGVEFEVVAWMHLDSEHFIPCGQRGSESLIINN